ncbi:hypothetical protein [Flavobacterium sp.]|uniref:hypothetical protein n=1 Tax=Flavobacterium sp. TaxID=239 RepID=UPI003751D42A
MTVTNNFLTEKVFKELQEYCKENEFKIVKVGDKEFSVLDTPESVIKFFKIDGYELILSFIRNAFEGFDNKSRIHADNIINGHKVSLASVLYINEQLGTTPNGTCFYKHHIHGLELTSSVTNEEFDRLLTEDANDERKWEKTDVVRSYPNRLLKYNAQLFHGKFPNEITHGERIVLVCFYTKN